MTTPKNLKEQLEALGAREGDEFVDDNGNEWRLDEGWFCNTQIPDFEPRVLPFILLPGLRRKPKKRKVEFWVLADEIGQLTLCHVEEIAKNKNGVACQKFEMEIPE